MSTLLMLSNKMRTLLLPPPLMPVSEVIHWVLSSNFHLACYSALNMRPLLELRRRRLTPSQAAVARVLPTTMIWCGVAAMAAAKLAQLLGASGGRRRRRVRLDLAYAALAAAAANHCLCAGLFALLPAALTASSWDYLLLAIVCTAAIVLYATWDLASFRSLRKAAAAAEEAAGSKAQ